MRVLGNETEKGQIRIPHKKVNKRNLKGGTDGPNVTGGGS